MQVRYEARVGDSKGIIYDASEWRGTGLPYSYVLGNNDVHRIRDHLGVAIGNNQHLTGLNVIDTPAGDVHRWLLHVFAFALFGRYIIRLI